MMSLSCAWRRTSFLVLSLGVAALVGPPAIAQSDDASRSAASETNAQGEQVGYLLADKVYAEPTTSSAVVTTITRDDRVRVTPIADKDGWVIVHRAEGGERVGYAFDPYVSRFGSQGLASYTPDEVPDAEENASPSLSDRLLHEVVFAAVPGDVGTTRIVRTWANVRVGPGMNYEAFGVIRPDTPFQVVDVERGWGEIRLAGSPSVGYVSASLLHRLPPTPEAVAEEPEVAEEPVRQAVVGSGVAGGGVEGDAETAESSQADALRDLLTGSGLDSDATVYVTRTGRKFHREGCKHLRSRTFAIPLAEAMLDYSPCRTCKPLQPTDEPEE